MVQVRVKHGVLEGEIVNNEYGGKYCSFKGIPYAEPPLGYLRFKAPQPVKSWTGVRNAKEHGPICCQVDYYFYPKKGPIGSEDCLYLNVYTLDIKPIKPLPVMVWIHGGGYLCGSGNDNMYGPEFLVKEEVILVTFNYRLHVLGFLSLNTEEIPGNAAMKDQVAALRWVKENIINFGGDPDNVTIFGESAGGASVAWHLTSPMSKGLFKRAIAQSGVAICSFAWAFEPRERAIALAKQLGLFSEDEAEISEFLKSVPCESLVLAKVPITFSEKFKEGMDKVHFSVVSEKQFGDSERFFYGDPVDALRNGIHEGVEVISGYCQDEGLLMLGRSDIPKLINAANDFLEYFVPKQIASQCSIKDQLEVGRKMKKFYFGDGKVSKDNVLQVYKYIGTEMFLFASILWQRFIANNKNNKVYLYKFTCETERKAIFPKAHNMDAKIEFLKNSIGSQKLVSHGDDLAYMFPLKDVSKKVNLNSDIYTIIDNITKLWTNFAKYGNPTPDESLGVQWVPYTLEKEDYLDIGTKLVPGTAPDAEEFEFWLNTFRQYNPHYVP